MKLTFALLAALLAGGPASAQPIVAAVLNSASYALPGLPNSSIAQGSIAVVFGTGLGPATLTPSAGFPLSATLAGTSTSITIGGKTVTPYLLYSLATQLAIVVPSSTPVGTGTITVTYNGQTSAPGPITVVASSFGVFTLNAQGTGDPVATFADYSVIGAKHPAHPGDVIVIWGTGLGPVTGDEGAAPLPGDMPNLALTAYLGSQISPVSYRGRSGCCVGLDQIVITVPTNSIQGCSVPLAIQIGEVVSNFTSIAVAPKGGETCSDPSGILTQNQIDQLTGQGTIRSGYIEFSRLATTVTVQGAGATTNSQDMGIAGFNSETIVGGTLPSNLVESVFTVGGCTVSVANSSTSTQSITGTAPPPVNSVSLDAGPALTVTGPNGTRSMAETKLSGQIYYDATLGNGTPGNYLDAGSYTIAGPGGADVGAFTASIVLPQPLVWTNESGIVTVNRSAGQQVTWTGGAPGKSVIIEGLSFVYSGGPTVGADFICSADAASGQFTIPALVLLSLPATGTSLFNAGSLSVLSSDTAQLFAAPGIDLGLILAYSGASETVIYQ